MTAISTLNGDLESEQVGNTIQDWLDCLEEQSLRKQEGEKNSEELLRDFLIGLEATVFESRPKAIWGMEIPAEKKGVQISASIDEEIHSCSFEIHKGVGPFTIRSNLVYWKNREVLSDLIDQMSSYK